MKDMANNNIFLAYFSKKDKNATETQRKLLCCIQIECYKWMCWKWPFAKFHATNFDLDYVSRL